MDIPTLASYAGMIIILSAFSLVSLQKLEPEDLRYQSMNVIGSAFLAYSALTTKSYAFVILNTVWAVVAVFSIFYKKSKSAA